MYTYLPRTTTTTGEAFLVSKEGPPFRGKVESAVSHGFLQRAAVDELLESNTQPVLSDQGGWPGVRRE